jgi:FKBP-type peptidyl-prolyl cis-trans isomerase 2
MNKLIPAGIITIAAIAAIAYFALGAASAQVVKAGDNVSVYYTGTFTNGTVFDSNIARGPLNFTVGANEVIPGFDQAVIGMRLNQIRNVTIPPSEAYGAVNPSMIVSLPISDFGNQSVRPGMIFTRVVSSGRIEGKVITVNATNATLDFNPPLAGKTLDFSIRVVKIQGAR